MSLVDKIRKIGAGLFFGTILAASALCGEPQVENSYRRIHGKEDAAATDSKKKKEFAKKIIKESQETKNKPWEECLEDHAVKHLRWVNDKEAYELILKIHEDDLKDFPDQLDTYLKLIIQDGNKLISKLPWTDREGQKNAHKLVAEANLVLGDFYERKGEYGKAKNAFDQAVNLFRYKVADAKKVKQASERANENFQFARKTAEFKRLDDLYAKLIQDFEKETKEKRFGGLRESQVKGLSESISKKDSKDLVQKILACSEIPALETQAVIYAARVKQSLKDGKAIGYWPILSALPEKAGKALKTPEFDINKAQNLITKLEEHLKTEQRRYSKADLLKLEHDVYTGIKKHAKPESLTALEASKRLPELETELKKYGGIELKVAVGGPVVIVDPNTVPITFEGTITYDRTKKQWTIKAANLKEPGIIHGNFAGNIGTGKPMVYRRKEDVPAKYDLALIRDPTGKIGMYFANRKDIYIDLGSPENLQFSKGKIEAEVILYDNVRRVIVARGTNFENSIFLSTHTTGEIAFNIHSEGKIHIKAKNKFPLNKYTALTGILYEKEFEFLIDKKLVGKQDKKMKIPTGNIHIGSIPNDKYMNNFYGIVYSIKLSKL